MSVWDGGWVGTRLSQVLKRIQYPGRAPPRVSGCVRAGRWGTAAPQVVYTLRVSTIRYIIALHARTARTRSNMLPEGSPTATGSRCVAPSYHRSNDLRCARPWSEPSACCRQGKCCRTSGGREARPIPLSTAQHSRRELKWAAAPPSGRPARQAQSTVGRQQFRSRAADIIRRDLPLHSPWRAGAPAGAALNATAQRPQQLASVAAMERPEKWCSVR